MSTRARRVVAVFVCGFAVCVAATLVWIAGELHYQSCVQRTAASTSLVTRPTSTGYGSIGGSGFDDQTFVEAEAVLTSPHPSRRAKLRDCSRSPL